LWNADEILVKVNSSAGEKKDEPSDYARSR
jgi:hypothetical protein